VGKTEYWGTRLLEGLQVLLWPLAIGTVVAGATGLVQLTWAGIGSVAVIVAVVIVGTWWDETG